LLVGAIVKCTGQTLSQIWFTGWSVARRLVASPPYFETISPAAHLESSLNVNL